MMNLRENFIQRLKQFLSIQKQQKQLLAVSGGVDSVVLCDLMFAAGYDFVIAHCNFQLREAESERDEQFVRSLGEKYNKEVLVKKFETEKYASEKKVSIQVAARELRYNWFNEIISGEYSMFNNQYSMFNEELTIGNLQPATRCILTAHHANDNIETLLMNFFKGTGISGLHGILPVQGKIIRPLLFAKKEELLAYAKEKKLPFVEDSSNLSDKYTRNFFRHNIIPLLKEIYPNVEDNLLNNIQRFTEAEELYKQSIELHKRKLLEVKGNEVHIPVLKLQKTSPLSTIVYEIIKDFGFTSSQVQEAVDLLESETGKYISSSSYRIIKNRNWLIISPKQTTEAANILIEETDEKVTFSNGELSFKLIDSSAFQIPSSNNIAVLDFAEITFPLLLRKWKQGDYFYPLGMKKKKKLSKFFIDQKLSKTDKENVWILEMNKKIIWIVGHRIDDRFKVLDSTKQVLKISWRF
jgi:tRNA(Ile)-lysidine synthase